MVQLNGMIHRDDVTKMILTRQVFPCFFGSALKLDGDRSLYAGDGGLYVHAGLSV